jgi:hypothetical protein
MSLLRIRAETILLIMGAYIVLNHGFMLLRVPPAGGFGVPLGELIIMLFAATFLFELRRLPAFAFAAPLVPLTIWWSLGFARAFIDTEEHGMWALRDASHVIDSLFLWIGFVAAATPAFMDRFSSWLRTCLNIGVVYSLCYPFRESLAAISPKLSAPAGYTASLFFNYTSASLVPLTAAMRWIVDRSKIFGVPSLVLAGALIVYCIVIFQMRTTYLQVLVLLTVLMAIQPRVALRMGTAMMFGIAALALLLVSGVEITGRLGEEFSLDFFTRHFAAIWGAKSEGIIGSASSGVDQRLAWWAEIWRNVNSSLPNFLFGLGYGIPLTDFSSNGVVVREPHNSLMSIIGRLGFVGLGAFVWFHLWLLRIWFRVYRWCERSGAVLWTNNMLILGVFFLLLWVYSLGEDAFEKPFNAIPYYFLWGVVLRLYYDISVSGDRALGGVRDGKNALSPR